VNHSLTPQGALRRVTAVLLIAAGAAVHAEPADLVMPAGQGLTRAPEAVVERKIDPWSSWILRFYADPAPGGDTPATRAGVEMRLLTRRLDAHQLQAGAAVAFSPTVPDAVGAWQTFDDRRRAVFVEDRWQWSSTLSVTAGARLIDVAGGAAFHERIALAWQPAPAWTLRVTDGTLQLASSPAPNAPLQRYRGVEMQTEHVAGNLHLQARLASQLVSDTLQPQVMHAAAVTITAPLDERWSLGSESSITNRGSLMKLKLSGSLARDRATVSLVVPSRFQGNAINTAFNANLPSREPEDGLALRTQLQLRF